MRLKRPAIHRKRPCREQGVVLIAVLMFIAVLLPVTLLILDSVRIESLLPVNEAYTRTAGDESDKGFYEALAEIMADQDPYVVDVSRDPADTTQTYQHNLAPRQESGRHEIDYLAESWARHPDNDTVFLVERSLENIDHPENPDAGADPDVHSVPVRWQLMNVPFGMDDFGEYYADTGDHPRILLPFEYVGQLVQTPQERRAPAFYLDPSELSMMEGPHEGDPVALFCSENLRNDYYWQLPPSDPNFYTDLTRLATIVQFRPRPSSYFRNTSGEPDVALGDAFLPATEGGFTPGFMRESGNAIDRLVYDGAYDFDSNVNQYPNFLPLQRAVTESMWANPFFGSTGGSATLASAFTTTNKEYKPAPGSLTKYQLGAQEGEAVPGWHETIVSDESGRFPINQILNIIFASHNVDYNDPELPQVRRDQWDDKANFDDLITNPDHPNHSGFLLARDMLVSLLMSDGDIARLADTWNQALYDSYQARATWIIRQMLERRRQLDEASDLDRDGLYDDESVGEIFQFPGPFGNNQSNTLDIAPPGLDVLDGSGRAGDGQDLWDGTWQVYTNPKDLMTDFIGEAVPPAGSQRITARDFERLNQRVTVYTFDTEHAADPDHPPIGPAGSATMDDIRYNINRMMPRDDVNTIEPENALYDFLLPLIGKARLESIMAWRDGLVDVNGDGDLNDEYIEQPVSDERYDPTTNSYQPAEDWPVSTFTYRERDNANFQDPFLPASLIDPDYLNLRNLGDLLMVPMSAPEGLVVYSEADDATEDPVLVIRTANQSASGPPRAVMSTRSLYADFTNAGTELAYDDSDDCLRNNLNFTNETTIQANRLHPSWGPGDGWVAYYNGDEIRIHDMINDTDQLVLANANLPPDTDSTTVDFWDHWTTSLIGDAEFEFASPDISPNGANNEIVFTQVAAGSAGDEFLDPQVAYNLVSVKTDGSMLDLLTDNEAGTYDYAPDFSSNGDFIVFTRTTYEWFNMLGLGGQVEPIPVTSLWMMDRNGGFQIPLQAFWDIQVLPFDPDPGLIVIDMTNPTVWRITLHQPMFPSISPDDQEVVFMDCPVTFTFDWTDPAPRPVTAVSAPEADIYRMPLEFFLDWSDMIPVVDASDPGEFETFPDIGRGSIRLARQGDSAIGDVPGVAIPLPNASLATNEPFTEADKQLIAMDIGEASLALRKSIGWGADDQNWLLKDLPSVPEHVVEVLKLMADVTCFRDADVTYDPRYQLPNPIPFPPPPMPDPPLQAYPGRVNINTADRAVLRTVFLNMFQGPENDPDDDGGLNGPEPRYRDAGSGRYINLLDPTLDDRSRLMALLIADRYAHQVVEYRKWIYNNQGALGITDETVPSNLPLYEQQFAGVSHYGNFRANPYYPLIDVDGDGVAPEVPRYDPEPPFRSVADLFNVMLYDDDAFSEDWTFEGIGGAGGPDRSDIPRPMDTSDPPQAVGTVDALDVWGPIYNTDMQRVCTHPTAPLGNGTLFGFATTVNNYFDDPNPDNYNDFYEHQAFRLFSADDFKRVAPFLTVRTYHYRIESRGVVRVSSGANRTDITRDKVWIICLNDEAVYGRRLSTVWDITQPLDWSELAQNAGDELYGVLYFEETPQSGLAVARNRFLAE